MTSLNIALRKAFWGALAVNSAIFFFHYAKTAKYYASIYPRMAHALYFSESWMNVWLIVLILSLIGLLREK